MVFKNLCILVLWMKVASALEELRSQSNKSRKLSVGSKWSLSVLSNKLVYFTRECFLQIVIFPVYTQVFSYQVIYWADLALLHRQKPWHFVKQSCSSNSGKFQIKTSPCRLDLPDILINQFLCEKVSQNDRMSRAKLPSKSRYHAEWQ